MDDFPLNDVHDLGWSPSPGCVAAFESTQPKEESSWHRARVAFVDTRKFKSVSVCVKTAVGTTETATETVLSPITL